MNTRQTIVVLPSPSSTAPQGGLMVSSTLGHRQILPGREGGKYQQIQRMTSWKGSSNVREERQAWEGALRLTCVHALELRRLVINGDGSAKLRSWVLWFCDFVSHLFCRELSFLVFQDRRPDASSSKCLRHLLYNCTFPQDYGQAVYFQWKHHKSNGVTLSLGHIWRCVVLACLIIGDKFDHSVKHLSANLIYYRVTYFPSEINK